MKKTIMILMALGLMGASSMAAPTFQNSAGINAAPVADVGVGESLTLSSFDGTSGSYVLVSVMSKTLGSSTAGDQNPITSLTYGGSAMTALNSAFASSTYEVYTDIYGIFANSTADIVLNYATADGAAEPHDEVSLLAASFSGVSRVGAISTGFGTAYGANENTLHDSITTTADDSLIVSAIGFGAPTTTTTYTDATSIGFTGGAKGMNEMFTLDAATAGAYAMDVTMGSSARGGMVGVELKAVPEPATVGMLGLGSVVALLIRRIRG